MTEFRLISHHLCPYVQRAVIVLLEKNIAHQRDYIDLAAKPDWFTEISPLGRVPVLETGGAVVFESQVIAEYLDEITGGSLHPADPMEKARHRSWIEFGSETLNAIGAFYSARDEKEFEQKRIALAEKFKRIKPEIDGPYFTGQQFHMIDGIWGTIFRYLDVFDKIDDFQLLAGSINLKNWRETIMARPSVANATPDGYPVRLRTFLENRNSHISKLCQANS